MITHYPHSFLLIGYSQLVNYVLLLTRSVFKPDPPSSMMAPGARVESEAKLRSDMITLFFFRSFVLHLHRYLLLQLSLSIEFPTPIRFHHVKPQERDPGYR